jgi:hypothetical protein
LRNVRVVEHEPVSGWRKTSGDAAIYAREGWEARQRAEAALRLVDQARSAGNVLVALEMSAVALEASALAARRAATAWRTDPGGRIGKDATRSLAGATAAAELAVRRVAEMVES